MQTLQIPYLTTHPVKTKLAQLSLLLDQTTKYKIDQLPWSEYPYKPEVSFALTYDDNSINLKYYVSEREIVARHNKANSAVYEDTCVEFFIQLNNSSEYYNFEFNCIGACQAGYGSAKTDRMDLSPTLIDSIAYLSTISKVVGTSNICWELTVKIPFFVFAYDQPIKSLRHKQCRVNFYKCGDNLQEPHFLTWNKVEWPSPNFHLPDFFGEAHFC